jgi:hypothetical protein
MQGTAGVHRKNAAYWLTGHFIRCEYALANSIVAALYSIEEMHWLRQKCDYHEISEYLSRKMQST